MMLANRFAYCLMSSRSCIDLFFGCSREPYVRNKFTRAARHAARQTARDYFTRFLKVQFETMVESWREIQSQNIEFVMKRLREPKDKP